MKLGYVQATFKAERQMQTFFCSLGDYSRSEISKLPHQTQLLNRWFSSEIADEQIKSSVSLNFI